MKRGDVILCPFPHGSGTPAKLRPAVIVQSDYYNSRIENLLVAGVTGNLANAGDPAHVLVDIATPEGRLSGLTRSSVVSCINLAVIQRRLVSKSIGTLPESLMQQVDQGLRMAMSL
jgi:mRNA interferase MazF